MHAREVAHSGTLPFFSFCLLIIWYIIIFIYCFSMFFFSFNCFRSWWSDHHISRRRVIIKVPLRLTLSLRSSCWWWWSLRLLSRGLSYFNPSYQLPQYWVIMRFCYSWILLKLREICDASSYIFATFDVGVNDYEITFLEPICFHKIACKRKFKKNKLDRHRQH